MDVLALDLSKRAAGWARYRSGDAKPAFGTWKLGSEVTSNGRAFLNLHRNLADQCAFGKPDLIAYEMPLMLGPAAGNTTAETQEILIGIAMHAESFCEAKVIGCQSVNMSTWRRHFIGSMPRGLKRATLKDYVIKRCQELGLNPADDNQADALGILDHALSGRGILPPWRQANILTRELGR